MKKRNLLLTFFSVLLIVTCALFVGCGTEDNADGGTGDCLTLSVTELQVEKYDTGWILADCDKIDSLTWSVDNPSVATIEKGKVIGVGVGETKVHVKCGKTERSCKVTVVAQDNSKFGFKVVESEVSLFRNDEKTLLPVLSYNNTPLKNINYSYSVDNSNVTVENGIAKAVSVGNSIVTATCSIEGLNFSAQINVNVVNDLGIEIQQGSIELYPFDEYDGTAYDKEIDVKVVAYNRGEKINVNSSELTWSISNPLVASVDAGKVTALKVGQADVTVTYGDVSDTITINVIPLTIEIDKFIDIDLSKVYEPDTVELFGETVTLNKIVISRDEVADVEFTSDDGSFTFSSVNSGDAIISMVSENISYIVKGCLWDGVIENVNELKKLLSAQNGNYALGTDIDLSLYTDNSGVWTSAANFTGVLNGNGYAIKNLKTNTGLFAKFAGTLKNIAFIDVVQTEDYAGVIAKESGNTNSIIDNIFVTISNTVGNQCGGLFGRYINLYNSELAGRRASMDITNLMVVAPTVASNYFGLIASRIGSAEYFTVKNSLFIGGYIDEAPEIGQQLNKLDGAYNWVPTAKESETISKFETRTAFKDAVSAESVLMSAFLKGYAKTEVVDKEDPGDGSVVITEANISDMLTATTGIFKLAEDIDMSKAYTANGGVWTGTVAFNGIIDGQGHTISNLKLNGALFTQFAGTLKNIAFTNISQSQGTRGALLASVANGGVAGDIVIDNVYLEYTSLPDTFYRSGGLFAELNPYKSGGNYKVEISNLVVIAPTTTSNEFGLISSNIANANNMTVTNGYFVGGYNNGSTNTNGLGGAVWTWNPTANDSVYTYADKAAFDADATKNLTTFLTSVLNK